MHLLINCICVRSVSQILSLKDFFLIYIYIYMTINLHFTSRKNVDKKDTQTNKVARLPDTNIPESTWEYKITNNNKHICKTEN